MMKNKKRIILIGLVIGLIAAYFFYTNFLSTGPSMKNRDTDVKIGAHELMTAFEEDEQAANELYLNKVVEVMGRVLSIKDSDAGSQYVELETMGFGVVSCTLEKGDAIVESDYVGKMITVKGECLGYLLDVQIGEAIIIK